MATKKAISSTTIRNLIKWLKGKLAGYQPKGNYLTQHLTESDISGMGFTKNTGNSNFSGSYNDLSDKPTSLEPYFANYKWYAVGDDAAIGGHNVGGNLCVKGITNTPGITLFDKDEKKYAEVLHTANMKSLLSQPYTLPYYDLEAIPHRVTQAGSFDWEDYKNHPYAGGGFVTFNMGTSIGTLLVIFRDFLLNTRPIIYNKIDNADGKKWQGGKELAWYTDIPTNVSQLNNDAGYLTQHQTVVDNAPTLSWGGTSTVATIGGTAIRVKMPANPNTTYSGNALEGVYLSGTTFNARRQVNTSTSSSVVIYANQHYCLGTSVTGTLTLTRNGFVSGKENVWSVEFTTGDTAPTITWSGFTNMVLPENYEIEANKHYEISVRYNPQDGKHYMVIQSWG